MAASAFPTHSPSASTIRKSFFDASAIGTISGNAIVAVYPITERKGKARNCFVSVQMTLFEVHKTQKDAKNKKAAKYLVDFADVFNVSLQNEPVQIKEDCICVMDPSTSYFIRPIDSDYDLQAWFDWILERSRECRCTKLLRPVFREEFFEAAWDVRIIYRPKLRRDFGKKQQNETQIEDLAEKKPQMLGHHRLCICPSSFLLFDIGCRPSPSIDRPFEKCSFIDLSLNVISNYGTQEKFFFVRIGRCSEIGSGELWMATEHGAAAKAMHERISQINQRESERRRIQGIKINLPTISSSVLKSRAHRERSQTQNMHKNGQKRAAASAEIGVGQSTPEAEMRKVSHNSSKDEPHGKQQNYQSNDCFSQHSSQSQLDARSHQSGGGGRVDSFSCLQSIPERCLLGDQQQPGNPAAKKNSIVGLFASRIGAKMSSGSCGGSKSMSTEVKMDQLTAPSSPLANTGAKTFDLDKKGMFKEGSNNSLVNFAASSNQTARNSLVSSVFGLRLTRRNSLTGSRNQNQTAQQKPSQQASAAATSSCAPFSAQPSYDCAEDYMTYDADDRCTNANHTMKLDSVGSRVSATNMLLARTGSRKSNSSAYSAAPMRQFSTSSGVGSSSAGDPTNARSCQPSAATTYGDYLMMDKGQNPTNAEPVFALHEVQSYISNSSESCCTPGSNNTTTTQSVGELGSAANAPRAYSLGSRPGCTDSATNCRPASSGVGRMPTIPHSQQLLHPCANGSSPPNYLKKSILSQTAKSIKSKQQQAAANGNNNLEEKQEPLDDDEQNSHEKKEAADLASAELRKRAHSVGSKTWFNPSMRQLSTTEIVRKRDENLVPPFPAADEDNNSRRNTGGAKSMGSGSSCYPHSMEDHALVDFTRDESPSIDSIPSLHSRNSSVGMQCPMGVRSALDSLSHSRGFGCGSPLAHCSDKSAEKQPGKSQQQQQDGNGIQQMKRKRSVPEMLQVHHHSNQQEGGTSVSNSEQQHQNRLHPNRRSTMDSSAVRLRNQNQQRQHRKSPPRHQAMAGGGPIPASQSTSSGISSRTDSMTASSTTTTESHKHCASAKEVGEIVEHQQNADADDDDYVMLNTPSSSSRQQKEGSHSQQQQKLTVRSIGTILESSSPNSSLSSDGEGKKRGKMKNREKASSSMSSNPAAFSDDYSLLMMTADDQQGGQPFASQSPPTSKNIANATTTTSSPTRAQLSASFSKRRSPSLSPNLSQQQRKMSVQEYQQRQQPNPARSYFPVREGGDGDPPSSSSPSSRRTTSTTADYARERQQQQREKSPRKFTCPNLGQQQQGRTTAARRMERQKATREEELGKEEECDYALIAEQPK